MCTKNKIINNILDLNLEITIKLQNKNTFESYFLGQPQKLRSFINDFLINWGILIEKNKNNNYNCSSTELLIEDVLLRFLLCFYLVDNRYNKPYFIRVLYSTLGFLTINSNKHINNNNIYNKILQKISKKYQKEIFYMKNELKLEFK